MTDANTSTENKLLPTHRRLWSWGWKSASDSDSANGKTSRRSLEDESDQVAWAGHFPLMRGGVVVFTLSANKSFSIAVGCEADLQGKHQHPGSLAACISAVHPLQARQQHIKTVAPASTVQLPKAKRT